MSEQVERKNVDWSQANCKGLDTEMFYLQQSELLAAGLSYTHLRRICFNCPIWKDCLQVGVRFEKYGFWGGLSEEERRQISNENHSRRYAGLIRDLQQFPHIKFTEILALIKSVKRVYGDYAHGYWKYYK